MILPPGVKYRPNRLGLVGFVGDESLIQVPRPLGYGITRYSLAEALEPCLNGAWYAWAAKHNLSFASAAYELGDNKEFVIEVASDIPTQSSQPGTPKLFASVFDVFTPEGDGLPPAVRACEFQTYGMALIASRPRVPALFSAQHGDTRP